MDYSNDPYIDEDGEALMDPDAPPSPPPGVGSPDPYMDGDDDDADPRDRSPTPVHAPSDKGGKPKKRLIKKSSGGKGESDGLMEPELNDWDDDVRDEMPSSSSAKKKRKKEFEKEGREKGRERKREKGVEMERRKGGKGEKGGYGNGSGGFEEEEQEMWNTVAGEDSENDQEGPRTVDDDNFIDDTGVDPADRYGSDNDRSPTHLPQAEEGEEDDEISRLFKSGKKKKRNEKSPQEIADIVENLMAELEVTAEEDAELNRQSKPAINKLRKLPLLIDALSKKKLQQEFLDHGVLTLLKNWLEPLPDGSLPNMNIRSAILKILTEFPIDLEQPERREQLKRSGLGKVIMFLSKSDEETTANRKLAKELVDKWSRPIFNKSLRFEDMRNYDDERAHYRRPASKKPMSSDSGLASRDDDLDLAGSSQGRKSGQGGSSRQYTTRPEASALDYVIRPQSKVDPAQIRDRAKQNMVDPRRQKMQKKLQQLKAPKKKNLQASKLSVEGRGMIKYL
ncbi:Transcription factor iws1 [Rhynchospora pubera]|uniref:Transcription factor iws1 n=1 Tax=Rhynchospora pubera TaxID=906938 RepID=A0AAV8GT92_9POAL|nr:Transcription factor iws1 [Rhynchospora pubera]